MKSTELRKISIENSKELVPKIIKDCLWAAEHGISEKIFDCSLNGFTKEHEKKLVKLGYRVEWINRYKIRVSWGDEKKQYSRIIRDLVFVICIAFLLISNQNSLTLFFAFISLLIIYFLSYDNSKLLAK